MGEVYDGIIVRKRHMGTLVQREIMLDIGQGKV